ncbi:Fic family protein [bacterium]|nr:MAG: Fic family protein [bacterium]
MRREDFGAHATVHLVSVEGDALAFVPDKLPPRRSIDASRLLSPLDAATGAVARLDGISRQIEHPEHLFRNYLRREAVLSSAIEGTHTTVAGLVLYEVSARGNRDAREVSNYVAALDYGLAALKERPITKQLFNEIHQKLMEGMDPMKTTPGMTRTCLVQLGSGALKDTRFVPPPDVFVDELLDDLVAYLNTNDMPPLIKVAIAHYQFEAIHPYRDGNGRIGRLLFMLYLAQQKILSTPMLYVSAYLESNRQQYYDYLLAISQRGTWDDWIVFLLEGVAQQARDAVERTGRISALNDDYRKRVLGPKKAANLGLLVDELFTIPAISVPMAKRLTGVTYPAARANIDTLRALSVLSAEPVIVDGTQYWTADGILELV